MVTAPAPPTVIPGGRYTPAFAVGVALAKYTDHLPLERQVRMMAREGLHVTRCESAKLAGIDPHAYLLTATEAALAA